MPLYHFDLRDGATFVVDDEGMELLEIESAQVEAVESLREKRCKGGIEPPTKHWHCCYSLPRFNGEAWP